MAHINPIRTFAGIRNSLAWGKNASALLFAAILIVCSVTVGCSSDKPKPVSSDNAITQTPNSGAIASSSLPTTAAEPGKPAPKKVVKKRPATVTYTDKTYGVSFAYPRKYALETGNAVTEVVAGSPVPMNFVQPGGMALAAVELPETSFPNTDLSSAYFNVSVHKALTAEQCGEFSVPQAKGIVADSSAPKGADQSPSPASASEPQGSKLMLGDMDLRGTEAVSGEGTRQSDAKYFHVFQNGACYEFALNVTTNASDIEGGIKHVDRDRVFGRLEKILATVKIEPMAPAEAPEVTASAPATPATAAKDVPAASPAPAVATTPATPAVTEAPATPAPTTAPNDPLQ
jgi:hypothetical protein